MARMPYEDSRKVFLVVAGGNPSAERRFEDTIQRKRTLQEVRGFLPSQEIENLEEIYHGSNFIVWGAVPGPMNESRWEKMAPGDVVLIYNSGRIRFAGEIAAKVRNKELARYFWKENDAGTTWEFMYFIVNEEKTDVPIEKLNPIVRLSVQLSTARVLNDQRRGGREFRAELRRYSRRAENSGTGRGTDPPADAERSRECAH